MARKSKIDNGKVVSDLSELCSKKQQEEGVWFQMETEDGTKWDIDVLVFGNDSDKVQKYERSKMKERVKKLNINGKRKNIEFDDDTVDEVFDEQIESVLIRFGGIKKHSTGTPLTFGGKEVPITKTEESEDLYLAILEGSPDISDFVSMMSKERTDFLAARKKN